MAKLSSALTAAAAVIGLAAGAHAQSNPDASQLIKALRPTGTISGTTRGIRPAGNPASAPASSATPAAMPAPAPAPAAAAPATPASASVAGQPAGAPSVNLSVQFANGSAVLTPAAMKTLDQLGTALTSDELKGYRFRIAGHTDTVGSTEYNLALSQQRAHAVAQYLESKFAIAASRLDAVGRGEEGLLVPTPPQTPEPRNRRVQITNLGS